MIELEGTNMQDIQLSIVVITYNQEKTISETLDSILEQRHPYLYELIIADDCSSDNTRDIINKYKRMHPHIIKPIFNDRNLGVVNNYFNAIKQSRGEIIMQCAGDDYWLENKIVDEIAILTDNPTVGVCYSKVVVFDDDLGKLTSREIGRAFSGFNDLLEVNSIPAVSVALRKSLIDSYMVEFLPSASKWPIEDYPMWLWMYAQTKFYFINKATAVYRISPNSISHTNDYRKKLKYIEAIVDIKKRFIKYSDNEAKAYRSVNKTYLDLLDYAFRNKNIDMVRYSAQKVKKINFKYWLVSVLSGSEIFSNLMSIWYRKKRKY